MWVVTYKSKWNRNIDLVPDTGRQNWTLFVGNVRLAQMHPREAADTVGDMNYRKLQGSTNQYEVRLTGKHRATFQVIEAVPNSTMHVLQVGGHT